VQRPVDAFVIAILLVAPLAASDAQLHTTRTLWLDPAIPGSDSSPRRREVWAEVQRGGGSTDRALAWDFKVGGQIELARWRDRVSVSGLLGHELVASPDNAAAFDPRGALWEEALMLAGRAGRVAWRTSYFFRCRHDIDNYAPPDSIPPDKRYVSTARVLILQGAQVALFSPDLTVGRRISLRASASVEAFTLNYDKRRPVSRRGPDWGRAKGAGTMALRAGLPLNATTAAYASGWGSLMVFGAEAGRPFVRPNGRAEVGVRVANWADGADVFIAQEALFDDLAHPVPTSSRPFYVGVRVGGPHRRL
jgi:hypothetical protein